MEILEKQKELNKIFKRNDVILAYLFGSAARKSEGPLSDVDIAVLFSNEIEKNQQFKKESGIRYEIEKLFRTNKVDILNLGEVKSPLLKYNAVLEGRLIFIKNKQARFYFESQIMKEYEDTRHLRNVRERYLYKSIKEGAFGKSPSNIKSKYLEKYVASR